MKHCLVVFAACLFALVSALPVPLSADWSETDLAAAKAYYQELDSAGLVVMHQGRTVIGWGDVSGKYNVASVRKSLLNSLYGIGYDRGWIRLDKTLGEIGMDDTDPPLSEQEKTATIEHLLLSRSGIVHRSLYEAGWWELMPERDEYQPGEHWIYNNWDFNALGTIWERESGFTIHDAFDRFIARPLGMQDFTPEDVEYETRRNLAERIRGNTSDHRLYLFKMSARDLARFGQLYLNEGAWGGEQLLSRQWIELSMEGEPTAFGSGRFNTLYGYLWWVESPGSGVNRRFDVPGITSRAYAATGNRGHYLYIVPACELVVAHTAPVAGGAGAFEQIRRRYFGSDGVEDEQFQTLLGLIVGAGRINCSGDFA
ncbi:MAG: serine hydrolase [Pseudohongiellaceae bacterium]